MRRMEDCTVLWEWSLGRVSSGTFPSWTPSLPANVRAPGHTVSDNRQGGGDGQEPLSDLGLAGTTIK